MTEGCKHQAFFFFHLLIYIFFPSVSLLEQFHSVIIFARVDISFWMRTNPGMFLTEQGHCRSCSSRRLYFGLQGILRSPIGRLVTGTASAAGFWLK